VSRHLLDWQHRGPDGDYSFMVARRDGEVVGIAGYIATRRFDTALASDNVLWLTTWKVRDDVGIAGLGLALLQSVSLAEPHVAIGAVGFNPETKPIYQSLGYRVGELQHYARPNAALSRFELASFSTVVSQAREQDSLAARELKTGDDFDWAAREMRLTSTAVPRKTVRYFQSRFACHPVYSYRVLALQNDSDTTLGLLATRTADHAGSRALRIVDFAGNPEALARCGPLMQRLVEEDGAEYSDIYNAGIDLDVFARSGFVRIDPDGRDVVPDHFEPFERHNVRLWYSFKGAGQPVLFKADSDQDRPSKVARDVE
jgi:hypothetical protein